MISRIQLRNPAKTVVDYDLQTNTPVLIFGDPIDPAPYIETGAYEIIPFPSISKERILDYSEKHFNLFIEVCKRTVSSRLAHVYQREKTPFTDEDLSKEIGKDIYPHWSLLFGFYIKSHTKTMVQLKGEGNLPKKEAIDKAIAIWENMTGEKACM